MAGYEFDYDTGDIQFHAEVEQWHADEKWSGEWEPADTFAENIENVGMVVIHVTDSEGLDTHWTLHGPFEDLDQFEDIAEQFLDDEEYF